MSGSKGFGDAVVRLFAHFVAAVISMMALAGEAHGVELRLTTTPDELVLGVHETARLVIEATGEGADDVRGVRLVCNVGILAAPRRTGPRQWTATYHLPSRHFPQVALFIARSEGVDSAGFGALSLPLRGRTEIAFRTDPGANVSVEVGDESFGPVRAARDGLVRVPVVVGPGQDIAMARSIDTLGNRSEREVPLHLPEYPLIAVLAPQRLSAGQGSRVAVFATESSGMPHRNVDLRTSRGHTRRIASETSYSLFALRAPLRVGDGDIELTADAADLVSGGTMVEITPARPASVRISTDREAFVPGSDQAVTVHALVRDGFGNIRPNDQLSVRVAGQTVQTRDSDEGGVVAELSAPPTEVGLGALIIEARSHGLIALTSVRLVGGPAVLARLEAPEQTVADGRTPVKIRILLVGETGLPASERPNIRVSTGNVRELEREDDGWWRAEYLPRRANLLAPTTATVMAFRGPASAQARIRLSPPIPWFTIGLTAGLQTNLGGLVGPEGRLELATRVGLARGWLELCVHSGIFYSRMTDELSRGTSELSLFQIPLAVGFGYGLNIRGRLGIGVSAVGGALVVIVGENTSFQADSRRLVVAPLIEGGVDVTVRVGRGELVARVGFGYATASEGSGISGNLLGLLVLGGYRLFIL